MLSLRQKHEYEQEIEQLRIDLLASMTECKNLNIQVLSLKSKILNYALSGKDLAMALIEKKVNGLDIKLSQISEYSGVSYANVANTANRLKNKKGK
ncbi:MAG: hypothetical protein Unbinned1520contig1002_21 [Prokaryotic dsDNA virus sp.]|nr:MAG: hypothetical protein Unbinned1520contig1002_21 [Prokaryotic dsDNA virus sp.]|tara:strand:- start:1131 stop:1418 length:288 start_codon:yes stop_codon:yes gene_type:complete